jgi:O-antigen ligase
MILAESMATLNFFKVSKFFVYVTLFSVIFVNTETLFPFIVTKYVFFRLAVGLALTSFLLGLLFNNQHKSAEVSINQRLKSPLVIAVSLFVFVYLLAGFFGFNPHNSFWSNFERGEGGFQMLAFYVFFLLLVLLFREKRDWLGLFKASLVVAVLMILYGFLAAAGIKGLIGVPLEVGYRFQGSLGNTAYVGTFLLFSLFYAFYALSGGFGKIKSRSGKAVLLLLIVLFLVIIWLTQSRGPFLGLGAGLVAFLLFWGFGGSKKAKTASVSILLVAAALAGSLYTVRLSPVMQELGLTRFFNIRPDSLSVQSRIWTWNTAIEGFKERPILGWGPENFGRVFDKHFDTRHFIPGEPSETWYDRAHNVFFDYLVAAGILGLLAYVGIFVVFYLQFFKKTRIHTDDKQIHTDKSVSISQNQHKSVVANALIFAMPIAYLVQGLVIFDVLPIYINLFLFLAFANYVFNSN